MSDYANDLGKLELANPDLWRRIGGFRTLEHILDWMKSERHSFAGLDLIAQDEFCHDLLMPLQHDWLVFGMT